MKLYVLFAQRKETYEGQHAPEAMECMDEISYDGNPDWLSDRMEKVNKYEWVVDARIFEIELPKNSGDFIRNQLMGKMKPINAVNVAVMEDDVADADNLYKLPTGAMLAYQNWSNSDFHAKQYLSGKPCGHPGCQSNPTSDDSEE